MDPSLQSVLDSVWQILVRGAADRRSPLHTPAVISTAPDGAPLFAGEYSFEYGSITWAREGSDGCVLALGQAAIAAVEASDRLRAKGHAVSVGVVSCPLALDDAAMRRATQAPFVLTVEDHAVGSGLAASVCEWLALSGTRVRLARIGIDEYQSSGLASDLYARTGLDADGIAARLEELLG